jgi:hypothetical protein
MATAALPEPGGSNDQTQAFTDAYRFVQREREYWKAKLKQWP